MTPRQLEALVHKANILMGAFEQMTVQGSLDAIKYENEALKGVLEITDPIGPYRLIKENWSIYEFRMGLDWEAITAAGGITPDTLLAHVDDQTPGTIPSYFRYRITSPNASRIFGHPGRVIDEVDGKKSAF